MQPDPMIEDGFAQAVAAHAKLVAQSSPGPEIVRDHGDATQAKLTPERSSETSSAEQTPSLSSGGEIEWSQLAIGALVGTIFAFGLVFLVRLTRSRTLAH
jgi:hypothetical protein